MKILATFITHKSQPDAIELVHAWDEYGVDENYAGYEDTLNAALASYGTEIGSQATVTIEVDDHALDRALHPVAAVLKGTISTDD